MLLVFCLSVSAGFAQIRTGGYKKVSVSDAGVVAAAEFFADTYGAAEELEITVDEIIRAERQTVAGTNYKLCLQILAADPEEQVTEQFVEVIVFRSLKNVFSIKSQIDKENCN